MKRRSRQEQLDRDFKTIAIQTCIERYGDRSAGIARISFAAIGLRCSKDLTCFGLWIVALSRDRAIARRQDQARTPNPRINRPNRPLL